MRQSLIPVALLGALVSLACTQLTEPVSEKLAGTSQGEARPQPAPQQKVAQAKRPRPGARGDSADGPGGDSDLITASHILVSYEGALRSKATRAKEDAKGLAAQLLERVRKGENFGELAVAHSDDPSAKANRGSLGTSPAGSWVQPFADAARVLRPGQISDLVETPFGFHIIKREK